MGATGELPRPGAGQAFVGRVREAAELVAGLEDAIAGRGRLFLITGEPGIGKTWLAEQLAAYATGRGTRVLWGRCWEGGGAPPFWPWAQMIRALAEDCDEETLAGWLGAGAPFIAQLPGLAEHLGTTAAPTLPSREADAGRFYLFEAVSGLFRRAASVRPLLLVLDDLHAADDPSMLLLRFLARDLRGARLLVVGTCREVAAGPAGIAEAVAELVREGQLLGLQGLDRDGVGELIRALSGVTPSPARVAAVHETTEGNPLFVREAVRLLAAQGALQRPGREVPIPGSIRAVIQHRLAPLSADAVLVLSAAAVVGREFDLALVGPACELPAERVLGALSEVVALGIVAEEPGTLGGYRFSHSLIREILYEQLPIPARAQLHRRVGEAIERVDGTGAKAQVTELARHFAEVAAAGQADAAKALAYARRAGERAMGMHAYEEAAIEYRRALQASRFTDPDGTAHCELLLRLGEAQARAGDYRAAKESCLQAAELARRLGAPEQFARAALVLGEPQVEGGLVNRQLVALLQAALDGLSSTDSPLRARLLARLSLELTFSDELHRTESLSRQAVEMARRLGDVASLGTALRTRWMAVWGPHGRDERSALASEMLELGQATGDRELELLGRARRAASSLESGDIRALEADIAAHTRLADELRMPVHRWTATTMRAMRALLHGAFEEAERLVEAARALQPGRPNVQFAHFDQLTLLWWEQGRLGELREAWQGFAERFPEAAFAVGWRSLADTELGHTEDARMGLRSLADQLPQLPRKGLWLPALALGSLVSAYLNQSHAPPGDSDDARRGLQSLTDQILELPRTDLPLPSLALASLASARLGEPDAAGSLYPLLLPYAAHVIAITMPHPIVCLGSASFHLGLLASVTSRWAEAGNHFEAAIDAHQRLEARPLLARTCYEYARMLLARGRPADRRRAHVLLDRALAIADALGMVAVAEAVRALQAAQAGGTPSAARGAEAAAPDANLFRLEGEYWTVRYQGSVVRLKDAKGLRHLARLLAHPGQEFHAIDLEMYVGRAATARRQEPAAGAELEPRPDLGDAGELLDATAKAAYRARVEELRAELEEAESWHDPVRAARAQEELDFLVGELARAVGLGGRDRRAASHAERARLNVTRAIRSAIANLARAHPALGRHLAATIRTGRYCSYTPDPRVPIAWER